VVGIAESYSVGHRRLLGLKCGESLMAVAVEVVEAFEAFGGIVIVVMGIEVEIVAAGETVEIAEVPVEIAGIVAEMVLVEIEGIEAEMAVVEIVAAMEPVEIAGIVTEKVPVETGEIAAVVMAEMALVEIVGIAASVASVASVAVVVEIAVTAAVGTVTAEKMEMSFHQGH
jgi:hypothetical protein